MYKITTLVCISNNKPTYRFNRIHSSALAVEVTVVVAVLGEHASEQYSLAINCREVIALL